MNQKLSWTLLAAGLALFFYQVGDLIANHSTWSEVWSPAGTGELLKTFGGAMIAVFGAAGLKLNTDPLTTTEKKAAAAKKKAAAKKLGVLVLLLLPALGAAPACGALNKTALTQANPTVDAQQLVKKKVIEIADSTRTGLGIADGVLTFADQLEQAGKLSPVTLRTLTASGRRFAQVARPILQRLDEVGADPNLLNTTATLMNALDPFLDDLTNSGNDSLKLAAGSIRIATLAIKTYGR